MAEKRGRGLGHHGPGHEVVGATRRQFFTLCRIIGFLCATVGWATLQPDSWLPAIPAGVLLIWALILGARIVSHQTEWVTVAGALLVHAGGESVEFTFSVAGERTVKADVESLCRAHGQLPKRSRFTIRRAGTTGWGRAIYKVSIKDGDTEIGAAEYEVRHQTPLPPSDA